MLVMKQIHIVLMNNLVYFFANDDVVAAPIARTILNDAINALDIKKKRRWNRQRISLL